MKNMRALQILFAVLFAGFMTLLASCGGGGGGYTPPAAATPPVAVTPPIVTTVTGVAASGKPIAGKPVTVKDAAGNSATGTTAADGSFTVTSTATFTPPFVVQVSLGAGASLYSVSADTSLTTNINVTPLTDLVVRSWYNVRGVATDAAFNALATNPPPATVTVQILSGTVQNTVQLWLNKAGVASTNFNLILTPFKADSTGVDKVLDQSTVTNASNSSTLTITDGTTAQTSTLLAASGSVTVTTTTKVVATNTVASTAVQVVPIATLPAQQTDLSKALAGVQGLFTNLISVASSKGAAFSATDAAAFVDSGYLDQGQNGSAFATEIVQFFTSLPTGAKVTFGGIARFNEFTNTSPTAQLLNVTVKLVTTRVDGSTIDSYLNNNDDLSTGQVYRLQSDGSWRLFGHQTIAKAHANVAQQRYYSPFQTAPDIPVNTLNLQAQVSVLTGTLSGAVFSGPANSIPACPPGATNSTPSPLTLTSIVLPKRAGLFNGNEDRFDLLCPSYSGDPTLSAPPPAGTPYSFTLTKSTGGTVSQSSVLNSATTDNGDITQINSVSRSLFAANNSVATIVGKTLTVTFTSPPTFPVLYSFINGFCQNAAQLTAGGGSDNDGSQQNAAATSGTVAVPTTCSGAPTAGYQITVNFVGLNGERSRVGQQFRF